MDSNVPGAGRASVLMVDEAHARRIRQESLAWPSWTLTPQQLAHVELMLSGALAPLAGFMTRDEVAHVRVQGELLDERPWPAPIVLQVSGDVVDGLGPGATLALRDPEGVMLAALRTAERWQEGEEWHVGGRIEGIQTPVHHDFVHLRRSPAQVVEEWTLRGCDRVIGFFPGRLLHLGQVAALARMARELDAGVLVQAFVEPAEPGLATHFGRLRALERAYASMPADRALLVATPDPGAAGDVPAAFELRAIVARNHGCTHVAVDPGVVGAEAVRRLESRASALGLEVVELDTAVSEGDVLRLVEQGSDVPASLLPPAVVEALRLASPPLVRRGFTVFFTGLSGSGKSTIASALRERLMELTGRPVTFLDGDLVRRHLSSELGFSREHRDLNILRIGWVASEITRHGGIAVCAPIAPYDAIRKQVRAMVEPVGGFLLVHVATPLEVCEQRDRKGLYAKARAGLIPQFTGVSDPYEVPADATLTIDTTSTSIDDACDAVLAWLEGEGYLAEVN